jgi:DUF1680 family protein
MTRRQFVGAAAAAIPLARPGFAKPGKGKAQPFDLKQVRLGSGPFKDAVELNRRYLHELEADRLLHMFRVTAGLPSSAEPLGGWERPQNELRGHFMGHYLSGCALMSSATGDDALKAKGKAIVAELAKCQQVLGNGYLSAFPPEFFDRLKAGRKVWAPWYTLHKIMAGLFDMHVHCGNQQALDILKGMADWTKTWTDGLTEEHMTRVLQVEFGGMNDVLYNLSAATGDSAYSALAHRFDHARIFAPLAQGRDELKGLHVNTQIPKIIGAARRYELTGEARYRDIAEFFWRQVTGHRSYATGGTSNAEHWRTDPDKLAGELGPTTQECCCTYNMLKLTCHLFAWDPAPHYADYYERALFNSILGTMNPEDGMTEYFVPLASGYWKLFGLPRNSFWCCTGTGVESFSKPADSIYFHDDRGVWVNLFIASEVNWLEKGVRIAQETNFPEEEGTSLTIHASKPLQLAVRIRIPYWANRGVAAKLNGKPLKAVSRPGSYLTIERAWKDGDKVELRMPMGLHAHSMPDDPTLQAFLYGPLVLAGQLGSAGLTKEMMRGDLKGGHIIKGDPAPAPDFKATSKDLSAWIKPVPGQTLIFRTMGQAQDSTLVPLYKLFGQRYAVYWRVV